MDTKRVYLVRHGETTYNRDSLVQDGTSLLSDAGKHQANVVAERLQNLSFQHLVVSDYERTRQTAEPIIAATQIQPVYSHLFREIRRPSCFFHKSRASTEFQQFLESEYESFGTDDSWRHSDEENFQDVSTRVHKALNYLLTLEGDVVVVSHGHFIRRITATVATSLQLDAPTWQKMYKSFWAVNTGITTIVYEAQEERWRILTFNDHAHFAE